MKYAIPVLAMLALSACSTYPGSPQNYAGINHGEFHIDPKTGAVDIAVTGGKDGENVSFTIKGPNGLDATYTATKVDAAAAQANLAAANVAIMEKLIGKIP